MLRYTVLLHHNQEAPGYSAVVPELPGCFSQGRTVEEALSNAKEAMECHLEALVQDGEEIPIEHEPFIVRTVEVEQPSWPRLKSA